MAVVLRADRERRRGALDTDFGVQTRSAAPAAEAIWGMCSTTATADRAARCMNWVPCTSSLPEVITRCLSAPGHRSTLTEHVVPRGVASPPRPVPLRKAPNMLPVSRQRSPSLLTNPCGSGGRTHLEAEGPVMG
jgi:hypothetical protein